MLSPYRALDLTDDKGLLCGKILADLGADVIKVEKPGGDPSRNRGPFYQDIPYPERSLYWWAYNSNKRGITLNIEASDGKEIFGRLVKTADFVIESFSPGYMDELGLSYSALSKINPRIIMTSISPFGQTGPYKTYKASDIVGQAMSGYLWLTGDPDRPPVRISFEQGYLNASAQAAAGTLVAHYYRQSTGRGQHVDVSLQQTMVAMIYRGLSSWIMTKANTQRAGCFWVLDKRRQRLTWRCADGFVSFMLLGGRWGAETNAALVRWMDNEGMVDDFLKAIEWEKFDFVNAKQEVHTRIEECLSKFFLSHTMKELYNGAIENGVILFPVYSIKGIAEDEQLKARDFWSRVEHPEFKAGFTYPGAWVRNGDTPETTPVSIRRAPLIGEHNHDIYEREMGMPKETQVILKQAGII